MKYLILFLLLTVPVSAADICTSKGLGYTLSLWNYTGEYTQTYGSGVFLNGTARVVDWNSSNYIDAVVYKSGSRTYTTDGGYAGRIPKTTLSYDIVFVAFCGVDEIPEFGLVGALVALAGALGVFWYVRK